MGELGRPSTAPGRRATAPGDRPTASGDRPTSLCHRLTALDQRLLDRTAAADSTVLDHVLPRLSVAANYGRLWLGVAAGLVLTGRADARRAAMRGLASLVVASATANVLAKGLARRTRPVDATVPAYRRLRRAPVTSAFPSGHSASAAAFATGVIMEMPTLALPVGGLAVAVMASRVVTGVHYPSDVVAGAALGIAAATLTRRWRRPRPASCGSARARAAGPRQSQSG